MAAEIVFYIDGQTIMSVTMQVKGNIIQPGAPSKVMNLPKTAALNFFRLTSDDERALVLVEATQETPEKAVVDCRNTVHIIFNWFTELNQKLPSRAK